MMKIPILEWCKTGAEVIYMKYFTDPKFEKEFSKLDTNKYILLIHGRNSGVYLLFKLAKFLYQNNYNILSFSYGKGEKECVSFERFKEQFNISAYTGKELVIIGHSKGGLYAQKFVEVFDSKDIVRSVITLSCPHQGSIFANTPLLNRSGDISELKYPRQLTKINVPFFNIYTKWDEMVIPSSSLENKYASENILIDEYEHNATLVKQSSFDTILEKLKKLNF